MYKQAMCAWSCLTLCDPMDYLYLGTSVHGIFQTRILEQFATSFSRGSSQPRDRTPVSYVSCIGRKILYQGHHLGSPWTCMKESESETCSVVSNSLRPHGLSPWNSPGKNTGAGSLSLLQEIFPTQGSNPGLPHCRRILYQLSHKGSPRIMEWVACPFSSGSS